MEDEILYRLLKKQATDGERKHAEAWLRESPGAERRYEQLADMLAMIDAVQPMKSVPPVPAATSLIEQADQRSAQTRNRRRTIWFSWPVHAIAAGAMVLLGVFIAESRWPEVAPVAREGAGQEQTEFITGTGELATAHLKDGTIVRLAPRTKLVVTQWGSEREVALNGRAFFAVAPSEGRVFRVRTDAGDAVVVGTRFELEASAETLRLAVVEGRVSFTANTGSAVEVSAGDLARVIDGQTRPLVRIENVHDLLQWTGRFLAFQSTPLGQAVVDIERAYDVRVQLLNDRLVEETITAWFVDRSLDEVLRVVSLALDANYSVEGRVVRIGR